MRERPIVHCHAMRAFGLDGGANSETAIRLSSIDTTRTAFTGGSIAIDASLSSQFVSALLMPAPLWRDGLPAHRVRRYSAPVYRDDAAAHESLGRRQHALMTI